MNMRADFLSILSRPEYANNWYFGTLGCLRESLILAQLRIIPGRRRLVMVDAIYSNTE